MSTATPAHDVSPAAPEGAAVEAASTQAPEAAARAAAGAVSAAAAAAAAAGGPPRRGGSSVVALQRTAGNAATARLVAGRRPVQRSRSVQRAYGSTLGGTVKVPAMKVPDEIVAPLKAATKAWPFELEKVEFGAEGTIEHASKDKNALSGGAQVGAAKDIGLKVSRKLAEGKWLSEAGGFSPTLSAKGGFEWTAGKTELSMTVTMSAFAHSLEGKLVIGGLDYSKETITKHGAPQWKVFEPKVTGALDVTVPITLDDGDTVNVKLKGTLSANFKPNLARIVQMLGGAAAVEVAAGAAVVAGGAAVVWFTYVDMQRRRQLAWQVRSQSSAIVKAAAGYGAAISGLPETAATSGLRKQAQDQGKADLANLAKTQDLTLENFLGLLAMENTQDAVFHAATEKWRTSALGAYRDSVEKQVRDWHSDNLLQSFFSGGSVGDDLAQVDAVIREMRMSGGDGFLR